MIAIFRPVNNNPGYEIREFEIINGKYKRIRGLKIKDYYHLDMEVYKPICKCKNKTEFNKQFSDIIQDEDNLSLF